MNLSHHLQKHFSKLEIIYFDTISNNSKFNRMGDENVLENYQNDKIYHIQVKSKPW